MPITLGIPGFEMSREERIAVLIREAGGPTKAAALIGRTRSHIDNMRKPGAVLRLEDLLPLCEEAMVSLDWVATGYQVRPDLQAAGSPTSEVVALRTLGAGNEPVTLFDATLLASLGVPPDAAAVVPARDDSMRPIIGKGGFAIVDTRPAKPRSGIHAVRIDDDYLLRRVNRLPNGSSELVADADPTWRFIASGDNQEALGLYRAVWAGQAL